MTAWPIRMKAYRCPCGDVATDTIALTINVHQWHCSTCCTQWVLVQSVIAATERRDWRMQDYRAWTAQKRLMA